MAAARRDRRPCAFPRTRHDAQGHHRQRESCGRGRRRDHLHGHAQHEPQDRHTTRMGVEDGARGRDIGGQLRLLLRRIGRQRRRDPSPRPHPRARPQALPRIIHRQRRHERRHRPPHLWRDRPAHRRPRRRGIHHRAQPRALHQPHGRRSSARLSHQDPQRRSLLRLLVTRSRVGRQDGRAPACAARLHRARAFALRHRSAIDGEEDHGRGLRASPLVHRRRLCRLRQPHQVEPLDQVVRRPRGASSRPPHGCH